MKHPVTRYSAGRFPEIEESGPRAKAEIIVLRRLVIRTVELLSRLDDLGFPSSTDNEVRTALQELRVLYQGRSRQRSRP